MNLKQLMSDWVAPLFVCLMLTATVAVAVLLALAE